MKGFDYLNPEIPAGLPRVKMPVVVASAETLTGYGQLVDKPDDVDIEIVRWPAQGWRPVRGLAKEKHTRALGNFLDSPVEACSEPQGKVIAADFHPFIEAITIAFCRHSPFCLSPDMLWLLICQGFSQHLSLHAESMREQFVNHQGQKTLQVKRDGFVRGDPQNDWQGVFTEFSQLLKEEIGQANHQRLIAGFSTTGPIEKAANEVALMDSMRSYFNYEVITLCGIPEIHLEGTVADWQLLLQKSDELGRTYGLEDWTGRMQPVLTEIIKQAHKERVLFIRILVYA